jgi:hypothetical protein
MAQCQVQDPKRTKIRSGRSYELRVAPERVDTNESAEYFASSRAIGCEYDALSGELLDRGDSQRVR